MLTAEDFDLLKSLSESELDEFLDGLPPEKAEGIRQELSQAEVSYAATIDDLARRLRRSPRRVASYLAAGMRAACHSENGYDVAKAQEWVEKSVEAKGRNRHIDREKKLAEVRKIKADAEAKEIRNLKAEGVLVEYEEVRQWAALVASRVRVRLEAMPDEFEMEFPAERRADLKERMDRYCRLVLRELHDSLCDIPTQ